MIRKRLPLFSAVSALLMFGVAQVAAAQSQPQVIDDSQLHARSITIGGASVLSTTRTVQHWFGSTLDPHNGITYGYNMVGANPNNCSGSACSVTIEGDITPIIVHVAGRTYDGGDVLTATLDSPQFGLNDYGSTPWATANFSDLRRG